MFYCILMSQILWYPYQLKFNLQIYIKFQFQETAPHMYTANISSTIPTCHYHYHLLAYRIL